MNNITKYTAAITYATLLTAFLGSIAYAVILLPRQITWLALAVIFVVSVRTSIRNNSVKPSENEERK